MRNETWGGSACWESFCVFCGLSGIEFKALRGPNDDFGGQKFPYFYFFTKKKEEGKGGKRGSLSAPYLPSSSLMDAFSLALFSITPALFKYLLDFINYLPGFSCRVEEI